MIRQVSWSEVSARVADAPARADRRLPALDRRRDESRRLSAAELVERVQGVLATPGLKTTAAGL